MRNDEHATTVEPVHVRNPRITDDGYSPFLNFRESKLGLASTRLLTPGFVVHIYSAPTRPPTHACRGIHSLRQTSDTCQPFDLFGYTETPSVPRVARPRQPDGAMVAVSAKVPEPIREELDRIADSENLSRSALLARVIARYVEQYPASDA